MQKNARTRNMTETWLTPRRSQLDFHDIRFIKLGMYPTRMTSNMQMCTFVRRFAILWLLIVESSHLSKQQTWSSSLRAYLQNIISSSLSAVRRSLLNISLFLVPPLRPTTCHYYLPVWSPGFHLSFRILWTEI